MKEPTIFLLGMVFATIIILAIEHSLRYMEMKNKKKWSKHHEQTSNKD